MSLSVVSVSAHLQYKRYLDLSEQIIFLEVELFLCCLFIQHYNQEGGSVE